MRTALTIIFVVICVIITILILCQEAKDNGLGSLAGGAAAGETYWGKNKGHSKIVIATTICLILFLGLATFLGSKWMN